MSKRTLIISLALVAILLAVFVLWAGAASTQKANAAHKQCAMGSSMMQSMHQGMKTHSPEQCPKMPECQMPDGKRGTSCGMQGHDGSHAQHHTGSATTGHSMHHTK